MEIELSKQGKQICPLRVLRSRLRHLRNQLPVAHANRVEQREVVTKGLNELVDVGLGRGLAGGPGWQGTGLPPAMNWAAIQSH